MLSAVIITYNEEEKIEDCIRSLQEVCSEIIIVDAESSDLTIQIAQNLHAKVVRKPWEGYGQARNYGANIASNDWILSIDADERLSKDLQESISHLRLESKLSYAFDLLTNYHGQWIRHGSLHSKWKRRLYNRQMVKWSEPKAHETLINIPGSIANTKNVTGPMLHLAYKDRKELESRLDKYASLIAQQWQENNYRPGWAKRSFGPLYHFIRSYILCLGFLDGRAGWEIAQELKVYNQKKLEYYKCAL